MILIQKKVELPYSCTQMFDLVKAIEQYPEFLPWCQSIEIEQQQPNQLQASVRVGGGNVHYAFKTLNRNHPSERIDIKLIEGPFKHLEGFWLFEPTDTGTRVCLELTFEFTKKIANFIVKPAAEKIATTLVNAFSERAKILYGK